MAKKSTLSEAIRQQLDRIISLIPNYDPKIDAGDCWFDYETAQRSLDFFDEVLTHTKGELAGRPLALEDWQKAIVANLFGWKRPDNTRRYREVLIFVPRKNGKTTLLAGLAVLVLFTDNEPGAEIYSAAADREQASLVFEQAKQMVLQCSALEKRAKVYTKSIVLNNTISFYKSISAEANTKYGYNSHMVIVDELLAQPNSDLIDVLRTSMGSRRQPLLVYITTSDYQRESICNEIYDYAKKVIRRKGENEEEFTDPYFLPVIYEAFDNDDWEDVEVWKKANPNFGISISKEALARECNKAKATPRFLNEFKRLHLNIRTAQATRWLRIDEWDECIDNGVDYSYLSGKPCYGGLDLSSTIDISAFSLVFPDIERDKVHVLMWAWVPEAQARDRERKHGIPYSVWARDHFIELTSGRTIDYDNIRSKIGELGKQYDIQEIGVDRYNATQIITQLSRDGFEIVPFGQGYRDMSAPSKDLEKAVLSHQLNHFGNPLLRWMASNVEVITDSAGNIKPVKPKHDSPYKIDGIISTVMAMGLAAFFDEDSAKCVYDTRGVIVL